MDDLTVAVFMVRQADASHHRPVRIGIRAFSDRAGDSGCHLPTYPIFEFKVSILIKTKICIQVSSDICDMRCQN